MYIRMINPAAMNMVTKAVTCRPIVSTNRSPYRMRNSECGVRNDVNSGAVGAYSRSPIPHSAFAIPHSSLDLSRLARVVGGPHGDRAGIDHHVPPSTVTFIRSSGRGAGPPVTSPKRL